MYLTHEYFCVQTCLHGLRAHWHTMSIFKRDHYDKENCHFVFILCRSLWVFFSWWESCLYRFCHRKMSHGLPEFLCGCVMYSVCYDWSSDRQVWRSKWVPKDTPLTRNPVSLNRALKLARTPWVWTGAVWNCWFPSGSPTVEAPWSQRCWLEFKINWVSILFHMQREGLNIRLLRAGEWRKCISCSLTQSFPVEQGAGLSLGELLCVRTAFMWRCGLQHQWPLLNWKYSFPEIKLAV